jgi:hypothetical protein
MKRLLFPVLVIFLISCSTPELRSPDPTPEPIQVIFSSVLKPWAENISACASNNPLVAIYYNPSLSFDTNLITNSITLELGEPVQMENNSYLTQIGREQIEVIVNQDNNLSELSTSDLRSIFSGKLTRWDSDSGQPIQVWVFPVEESIRKYFDRAVLQSHLLSSDAMLAPDPDAMLQAVSNDPNAIGYLPGSIISTSDLSVGSKVKIIQIEETLQSELNQPVISITPNEPVGLMRELLVCLQASVP